MKHLHIAFLSQVLSIGVAGIALIIMPIRLSIVDFGKYQWYLLLCSYIGLFHFGLADGILLRIRGNISYLYKRSTKRQFGIVVIFEILVALILLAVLIFIPTKNKDLIVYYIAIISIPIINVAAILGFYFQGVGKLNQYYLSVISQKSTLLALFILLYLMNLGVDYYIISYFASLLVQVIYLVKYAKKLSINIIETPKKRDISVTVRLIQDGSKLLGGNLVTAWVLSLGLTILKFITDGEVFGMISYASLLGSLFIGFFLQIGIINYPIYCKINNINIENILILQAKSNMIIGSIYIATYALALYILNVLNNHYGEAIIYAVALAPAVLCEMQIQALLLPYLKANRKMREFLLASGIALIFFIILSIFAIINKNYILELVAIITTYILRYILASLITPLKKYLLIMLAPLLLSLLLYFLIYNLGIKYGFIYFNIMLGIFLIVYFKKIKKGLIDYYYSFGL